MSTPEGSSLDGLEQSLQTVSRSSENFQHHELPPILLRLRTSVGTIMASFYDLQEATIMKEKYDPQEEPSQAIRIELYQQWKPIIRALKDCYAFAKDANYLRELLHSDSGAGINIAFQDLISQSKEIIKETESLTGSWEMIRSPYDRWWRGEEIWRHFNHESLIVGALHEQASCEMGEWHPSDARYKISKGYMAQTDFYNGQRRLQQALLSFSQYWVTCYESLMTLGMESTLTKGGAIRLLDHWPAYQEEIMRTITEITKFSEVVKIQADESLIIPSDTRSWESGIDWKPVTATIVSAGGAIAGWCYQSAAEWGTKFTETLSPPDTNSSPNMDSPAQNPSPAQPFLIQPPSMSPQMLFPIQRSFTQNNNLLEAPSKSSSSEHSASSELVSLWQWVNPEESQDTAGQFVRQPWSMAWKSFMPGGGGGGVRIVTSGCLKNSSSDGDGID